jgi:hypothetical protein
MSEVPSEARDLETERQHLLQEITDTVDPEIMRTVEAAVACVQQSQQWDLVTTGEGSVNAKSE